MEILLVVTFSPGTGEVLLATIQLSAENDDSSDLIPLTSFVK